MPKIRIVKLPKAQVGEEVKKKNLISTGGNFLLNYNPLREAREEALNYSNEWYNSPMYKKNFQEMLSPGEEWMGPARQEQLRKANEDIKWGYGRGNYLGETIKKKGEPNMILINYGAHGDNRQQSVGQTGVHEVGHIVSNTGEIIPSKVFNLMKGYLPTELNLPEGYDKKSKDFKNLQYLQNYYLGTSPEKFSKKNADELGQLIKSAKQQAQEAGVYNPFTQEFTPEMYDKYEQYDKNGKYKNSNFSLLKTLGFSKEALIDLFNKSVAKNDDGQNLNVAKTGGALNSYYNNKIKQYGPGGESTDGCPTGFYKHSMLGCVPIPGFTPNQSQQSQVKASSKPISKDANYGVKGDPYERIIAKETEAKQAEKNKDLAKRAAISAGIAGAIVTGGAAAPYIMPALEAPIAGVAGLTGNSLLTGLGGYNLATNINNGEISNRFKNAKDWKDYAVATGETAFDVAGALPMASAVKKGLGEFLESGLLSKLKSKPTFKSDINWGEWNSEIPSNQGLINEYNAIEQTSKANGSWMKNPDGSAFQGTPEQFVQQNSENFKKAFPEGATTGYRGAHEHIDDFANRKRSDYATFLTDSKVNAETYATSNGSPKTYYHPDVNKLGESTDGIYELGIPNDIPRITGSADERSWRLLNWDNEAAAGMDKHFTEDHNEYLKNIFDKGEIEGYGIQGYDPSKKYLSTDAYANYVKNSSNPEAVAEIKNVKDQMGFATDINPNTVYAIDSKRVNLKSLRHNNGMFDMTNPNIYKALIPAIIGAGALQKKKKGGVIKDDRGQYKQGGSILKKVRIVDVPKYAPGGVASPQTCYDPKTGKEVPCKDGAHKTMIFTEHPRLQGLTKKNFEEMQDYLKNGEFTKEAEDLKNYLIKNQPGEDIEIYPTYVGPEDDRVINTFRNGQLGTLNQALSKSTPNTRLAFMAHHGSQLFGQPYSELGKKLQATNYDNCYLGSCYSGDIAASDEFKGLSNFHFRPGLSPNKIPDSEWESGKTKPGLQWLGVNPNRNSQTGEAGINNAFYNTTYDGSSRHYVSSNPKEGVEYGINNPTNQPHIGRGNTLYFGDMYNDNPQKYNTLDNWNLNRQPVKGYTYKQGGELPKAQDGWLEKLKGSVLNPYNWGVEDYSKEKDFTKAYNSAKKTGEKEFMYKGKRYNTKYAGTPRQEVGTYGADGKPIHKLDQSHPAQVNLYPPFGNYIPGHVSAGATNVPGSASVDYSRMGNYPYGIAGVKKKGEHSYYVYGADQEKIYDKASSLPSGDYFLEDKYTPSDWNLFTNNCADNVCDAFGIPRSKGIQTPTGAVSKIKEKYPTIDVTGRTYDDYENLYRNLQDQPNKKILSQSKDILGIASSPDLQQTDISKKLISTIQGVLADEGFAPSKSQKYFGGYDGVYGPETKKALEDWQKKNKSFAQGGVASNQGYYNVGMGVPRFDEGGGPCYDAKGNVIPCDQQRLQELGSDAYTAMQPFYSTVYEAGNKYANPETGLTSPLNSLRATMKGLIKHPKVIFMRRHNIPSNLTDQNHNPYDVEGYRTPLPTGTRPWYPTQWAEPRKEHHGLEDWFERMRIRHEENKAERQGRRDRGKTGCWGANCTEDETQDQAKYGGDISIPNLSSPLLQYYNGKVKKFAPGGPTGPGPGDGQTVLPNKKVGEIRTPIGNLDLRPIYPSAQLVEDIYDPKCDDPNGPGCSYQATRNAMKITGLPMVDYAPADAAFRDAVAERTGLQNIFGQEGEQKRNANSGNPGWKYPTSEDFKKWKAGDIVVLDAPGVDYFHYNAPPGFTEKDNSGASHNGVIAGFTFSGQPVIKHGYATGTKGHGTLLTEVLGDDNRVSDLGHGRYAVKSIWRPKEIGESGDVESIKNVIETGEEQAKRKTQSYEPTQFSLDNTYEEKLKNDLPVAAAFSGADTRLSTKNNLVNLFNNKELDKELQYKLGISAQDLQNLKPVVFGIAGQETNFNDVDNPLAAMKDVPGDLTNTGNSKGLFQIKFNSLTDVEKKVLGIKSPNDLLDNKKAYKAAILMMHNAKNRMDKEVEQGTHPGLKEADPFFRAAYYYNSPARAISTAKEWAQGSNPAEWYNPTTWFNPLSVRERPGIFASTNPNYVQQTELRMDKGSYPYKLMQNSKDLLMFNNSLGEASSEASTMEPLVIRGMSKNSKSKYLKKKD